jgi:hypothetical protein
MGNEVGVGEGVGHGHIRVVHTPPGAGEAVDVELLRTGPTGLRLTSTDHRLLPLLNDPEVTTTASRTLTTAPDTCCCTCFLPLNLIAAPVFPANIFRRSAAHIKRSRDSCDP